MLQAIHTTALRHARRGVASVMAMLFMVVFSAMALGFYAATTTAVQVSSNERTSLSAQVAVESGLQFLRYHLSALDIPDTLTPDQRYEEIHTQLSDRLNGTANLGGSVVGFDGTTISVPASGFVRLSDDGSQKFRITMTRVGDKLLAKVIGRGGSVSIGRGVEIEFSKAMNATAIFNFGVASRGRVLTSGNSTITGATDPTKGSILSTSTASTPVEIFGKKVSGDVSITGSGTVKFGSNVSIGGTTNHTLINAEHIHKNVPEPRFPDIDTTVYQQEVTNTFTTTDADNVITTATTLENCRIPDGTGTPTRPLVFEGPINIIGVLYIEGSNVIEFKGNTSIQGVIVTANDCPQALTQTDSSGQKVVYNNVLNFTGSVTASPIQDLDSTMYSGANWDRIRDLDGAFIIAPNYRVRMWGNFGTVGGSVICAQFQMGGSAEGTVMGSIIQMRDDVAASISGSADVVIASTGTTEYPPGVTFGHHFTPVFGTYREFPVH